MKPSHLLIFVIWALFTLYRICKTNLCNSAVRPEHPRVVKYSHGETPCPSSAHERGARLMEGFSVESLRGLRRAVGPCRQWEPQHVCLCPCQCTAWSCTGWGAVADWSSLGCIAVHVCGQCAREPGEGEQFLLPAVVSSGTAEARVKNCSLEPTLCSCFLSSRPLLLVLLSSETEEFPSFIYIITLKVFIDCD